MRIFKCHLFSFDPEKYARWLTEMSAKGFFPKKTGLFFTSFIENYPERYRFHTEPPMDSRHDTPSDYISPAGWTMLDNVGRYNIFYSPLSSQAPFPDNTELKMELLRRNRKTGSILFFAFFMVFFIFTMLCFHRDFTFAWPFIIYLSLIMLLLIHNTASYIQIRKRIKALRTSGIAHHAKSSLFFSCLQRVIPVILPALILLIRPGITMNVWEPDTIARAYLITAEDLRPEGDYTRAVKTEIYRVSERSAETVVYCDEAKDIENENFKFSVETHYARFYGDMPARLSFNDTEKDPEMHAVKDAAQYGFDALYVNEAKTSYAMIEDNYVLYLSIGPANDGMAPLQKLREDYIDYDRILLLLKDKFQAFQDREKGR